MPELKKGCLVWTHSREDNHQTFQLHLEAGGVIHRSDPLNGIEEDLTADTIVERFGCVCRVRSYGYADLTCIPLASSR